MKLEEQLGVSLIERHPRNIMLTPAEKFTLEQALAFINDDELMEVTPVSLRLRKRHLKEHERKTASRRAG